MRFIELRLDEVTGTIHVEGPDSAPLVVADLVAARPVQVVARLDGQEVRLTCFGASQQESSARTALLRRSGKSTRARVQVSVVDEASGTVLQSTVLRPGGDR